MKKKDDVKINSMADKMKQMHEAMHKRANEDLLPHVELELEKKQPKKQAKSKK